MRLPLSPDHFLKIVVGRNNNSALPHSPAQNLIVTHSRVFLADLDNVMPQLRDLCITPPFARLLRQAQISILEILNVFLWLKLSPSLYLAKIGRSSKVSLH